MFVKCIKDISVFKIGKCYSVCNCWNYGEPLSLYHENQCDIDKDIPMDNFELVRVHREGVFSYLIRENNLSIPLGIALEYSYKDGIEDQVFYAPTPSQERYLLHKMDDWEDAWNREP